MPASALPDIASVVHLPAQVVWWRGGEVEWLAADEAKKRLRSTPAMFCHRGMLATAIGMEARAVTGLDVLELYAFVRPTRFAVPSVAGLLDVLGLPKQAQAEDQVRHVASIAQTLLKELAELPATSKQHRAGFAQMMMQGGWGWGQHVLAALDAELPNLGKGVGVLDTTPAQIWHNLPTIAEQTTPPPPPLDEAISDTQVMSRLNHMLGKQTIRPQQEQYCRSLTPAFARKSKSLQAVIATAGTGTGKTLGYLAPATVWAEANEASVWISTYTRNLQHQIETETTRLYTDKQEQKKRVVIRKGRENYLCLLNLERGLEDAAGSKTADAVALGLMARWAEASGDGDVTGDRFPSWLTDIFGWRLTKGLSDKPGECIHAACPHHAKCFIEGNRGRARQSHIVIANHAVVMMMALINSIIPRGERPPPTRYVFDEGHHLFDAADSAFATEFTADRTADLRRWLRGDESGRRRGIYPRLAYALQQEKQTDAAKALESAVATIALLPAADWLKRFRDKAPHGRLEQFFWLLYQIVVPRNKTSSYYSIDKKLYPADPRLLDQIGGVRDDIEAVANALHALTDGLRVVVDQESTTGDKSNRQLIEGVWRGLQWRALAPAEDWLALIDTIIQHSDKGEGKFVDWIKLTREDGSNRDIGLHRHWLDPMRPFAKYVLTKAHGTVITSASLTDSTRQTNHADADDDEWRDAERMVGMAYLNPPARRVQTASPFDYAHQARVFVASDLGELAHNSSLSKAEIARQAEAVAQLMIAAGGGGLALFTAIMRMKAAHPHVARRLAEVGLPLYAQHIGGTSLNTLVQIFRTEPNSCLMGTNALRDGVDVTGEALRLIVFDRLPWPGYDVLTIARAKYFGGTVWRERQVRMRLRQAFGRLIRHEGDRGVFVMLDNRMDQRFASAFPHGVTITHTPMKQIIGEVKKFFTIGD